MSAAGWVVSIAFAVVAICMICFRLATVDNGGG